MQRAFFFFSFFPKNGSFFFFFFLLNLPQELLAFWLLFFSFLIPFFVVGFEFLLPQPPFLLLPCLTPLPPLGSGGAGWGGVGRAKDI